jgi:hypothetical protein
MSTPFIKEYVDVPNDPAAIRYRLQSKLFSFWYITERYDNLARMGNKEDAIQETQAWWEANLSYDWQEFYALEEVFT